MKPGASSLLIAALAAALALSGCVTKNSPGDLRLVSLTAVDYYDQQELPQPNSIGHGRPHELLLLAKITSASDLTALPDENTLGIMSYLCQRSDARVFLDLPYIFTEGREVHSWKHDGIGRPSGSLFTYDVYFRVARKPVTPSRPSIEGFNLRDQAEDICFNIVRGAYRKLGYSSNTVTISHGLITRTLDDAGSTTGE